ncbi:MAG: UDP-galactopyranose mutase [Candidatus Aenigmatarchaeota archaeon]
MFEYIIVGAGLSGCVIAERIASVLKKKVLVIEKRHHIGGNCYDYIDENGIIVHKYGPHLFHTDYKEVFEYLSNFTDWRLYEHRVLANINGYKVPIPFNFNSIHMLFPENLANYMIDTLIKYFGYGSKIPILELKKSNDENLKLLADFIYKNVFYNYTRKQWGFDPEKIDPSVTARVPVYTSYDNRYFTDKYQAVPEKGYNVMFNNMINNVNIKILLNTDFKELLKIDVDNQKIYFLGNIFKGKLIFTGMIDELFDYRFGTLPYRSLKFDFKTIDKDFFQEVATINYPNNYDFTRITEFKHVHPSDSKKSTIVYEYPQDYDLGKVPYYPVFTDDAKNKYTDYLELSKKFTDIILVGRLAEYRYYDMDDAVKRALEIFDEKIK